MSIKNLKIFSLLYLFLCLFLCLFLITFADAVVAETENKTIKINVYVSYSLSGVIKEAAENFKQNYLAENVDKGDKKIDFDFNFFVNSNSILLSKIAKSNQDFDLFFCDSQKVSQMALQQNLIHQNYAFLSDSILVIAAKNLTKIPQNIKDLQDFHIHRILISQAEDDNIFKYIKNIFQQQDNYKIWDVLENQQNKIFYTNSPQQNLDLLANNQAEVSFVLSSEFMRFIDKDKLQVAFEFDPANNNNNVINYFSAVNVNKDYQANDNSKQQYSLMQNFLDYLLNNENKNYESFVKIYKKYGYQEAKQEVLQVQ